MTSYSLPQRHTSTRILAMRNRLLPAALRTALLLACVCLISSASLLQAQDWAKQKLDQSPRHREWVSIKYGNRTVKAFVVYPEVKGKVPVVLVIHEIFGLVIDDKRLYGAIAILDGNPLTMTRRLI